MKPEFDRVKNDVETMQKAMGLAPSLGREWVQWVRRDNWLNLWWCLPGIMLIASSFLPAGHAEKHFGLALAQWTGILVAAAMLAILVVSIRKMTAADGRPPSLVREYKRFWGIDAQGKWVSLALILEFFLYFAWAKQFQIHLEAFWSGLFILAGSTFLVLAVISRLWSLLGWAIPLLAYGLYATWLPGHGKISGIPLGMMFIAIALSGSFLQAWQIRQLERQHESH
jgi:drug/metabolite transporter superfamily protein YnfA